MLAKGPKSAPIPSKTHLLAGPRRQGGFFCLPRGSFTAEAQRAQRFSYVFDFCSNGFPGSRISSFSNRQREDADAQ